MRPVIGTRLAVTKGDVYRSRGAVQTLRCSLEPLRGHSATNQSSMGQIRVFNYHFVCILSVSWTTSVRAESGIHETCVCSSCFFVVDLNGIGHNRLKALLIHVALTSNISYIQAQCIGVWELSPTRKSFRFVSFGRVCVRAVWLPSGIRDQTLGPLCSLLPVGPGSFPFSLV